MQFSSGPNRREKPDSSPGFVGAAYPLSFLCSPPWFTYIRSRASPERTVSVRSSLMSARQEPHLGGDEASMSRFPVHRACRDGDVGALAALSEPLRAHLTAEDPCYGWTPVHWAAHYGQLECMARLVQMGCGVNVATSRFDQTPAHTAVFGGHPHCLVWLTQAGADVNRQDFVGEAPIHKAARSGSLECVQVLLIAGAKPHLRNASGQTAADLARAHGFLDCFRSVSNAQKHLLQLGAPNGGVACGLGRLSGKRPPTAVEPGHLKKARKIEDVLVHVHGSGGQEVESMESEDNTKGATDGHHQTSPHPAHEPDPAKPASPPPRRSSVDMCGSLHLSGSPSSCVSQRPAWWRLMGAECGDFQRYGHYHGFGDTAEELSDGVPAVGSSIHLYHVS